MGRLGAAPWWAAAKLASLAHRYGLLDELWMVEGRDMAKGGMG